MLHHCLLTLALLLIGTGGVRPSLASAADISFERDVLPVLSRAGCNAGACHGNLNGKGGFRLSLKGEDPATDHAALTRDMLGRRTDPHRPSASLILQKATGGVPHEGGGFTFPNRVPNIPSCLAGLRQAAHLNPRIRQNSRSLKLTPATGYLSILPIAFA